MLKKTSGSRRSVGSVSSSSGTSKSKINSSIDFDMELPDEPSEPDYNIDTATIFIHGEQGIGKTTIAREFPDPLFLMFEPGARYLRVNRLPKIGQFAYWKQFTNVIDKLEETDRFKTIVIDTADLAYELSTRQVLKDNNEKWINEGSLGYGKGLDLVDEKFKGEILRITGTGRGVIFISHTKSQEFERGMGGTYQKLVPTIKDRGRRFINGFVDITGCYMYDGNDRILTIRGSDDVDAKCRIDGKFLTPKGEQVISIPMGSTSEEAYKNFMLAFNNKQEDEGELTRRARLSEIKAKIKPKR